MRAGAVALRRMTWDDLDAVREMEAVAFAGVPEDRHWQPGQLEAHLERFPEGQWVAELEPGDGGRIVGSCTNMRTKYRTATAPHTWRSITARGSLTTHDPAGSVLYGTEIMVHPNARRMGVGRRLFKKRFAYVVEEGLRAFVTGGRLPGYGERASEMTARDYVQAVARGDLTDPVLTPELRWGLEPRGVLCGYMVDPPSLHHATLVVWENPEWSEPGGGASANAEAR